MNVRESDELAAGRQDRNSAWKIRSWMPGSMLPQARPLTMLAARGRS